jgi:hypothetical protein
MNASTAPKLLNPRYEDAKAQTPGNPDFWAAMLDQSDNFAFQTARDGKGGPFGAQLWLYNPSTDKYLLVGTPEQPEDSNAVVSKGMASAHAEAENLSPENRRKVFDFLQQNRGQGWHVVQASSGESCQSCRSKQVLFAEELKAKKLIDQDGFHVVFKATYDQTKRDANFNDAPYDMAFRAIAHLGLLDKPAGLFGLDAAIKEDAVLQGLVRTGDLIYNPVTRVDKNAVSPNVQRIFETAGHHPVAIVVSKEGDPLSYGIDLRDPDWADGINLPEKTAIVSALRDAAQQLRKQGIFESWNLNGARVITNITDIGPQAYGETLWCNLSGIEVVPEYGGEIVDMLAQEVPGVSNRETFKKAAQDYNVEGASIGVEFRGDPESASIAHQYWAVHTRREALLNQQAERVAGLHRIQAGFLGATTPLRLTDIVESSLQRTHYDGKQAQPDTAPDPKP